MELVFPLLIVGFVVLLVSQSRRQRKEVRATQEMQASLEVGARVMTTAGLHATVVALDEDTVDLEVAPGVVTTWSRLVIRQELTEDDATDDLDGEHADDATADPTAAPAPTADGTVTGTDGTTPSLRKS